MASARPDLNRHPDFLKLWAGQTVSLFGSAITTLALSLTGVLVLEASPLQMGILGAAGYAPFLLLGLFAGVWVDRLPRRPILIGADVGRAILLVAIPLATAFDLLRIEQLYAVAFLVGALTVFFDVAYQSYLPALVERGDLVEANSKLEASRSLAQIGGPSLAGWLVQVVSAPFAILGDAASFLVSAIFLGAIRKPEPSRHRGERGRSLWREVWEGLTLVARHPLLRANAGCTGTWNLFSSLLHAVYVLYLTRELGLEPMTLGVVLGVGSVGALLGAVLAGSVARRFGTGPAIVGAAALGGASSLLIPLAGGPPAAVISLLMAAQFVASAAGTSYNVNTVSLRQTITADHLQGRMNATIRFLVWGVMPIGALLGGVLGEAVGVRTTLWLGALGATLSFTWVFCSPLRRLRTHSAAAASTD